MPRVWAFRRVAICWPAALVCKLSMVKLR